MAKVGWFCGVPRFILEDMTRSEVEGVASDWIHEATNLKAWNKQRPDPVPQPGFFDGVPPLQSMAEYDWRVRAAR